MEPRDLELAALLVLLRRWPGGAGWNEIAIEVAARRSAIDTLAELPGDTLFADSETEAWLEDAQQTVRQWRSAGYHLVTVLDEDFPQRLLEIRETPPFLFYEGKLREPDPGVSVVGSREASDEGLRFAADAARLLASEGLTVIAGLASGIDTAAHRAALDAGSRTVAFVGTGITKHYPAANAGLQKEIASRGLVFSQFYPDAPTTKQTFPMRNATMSGYGLATIVVEAGEFPGTRIQARVAGQHGRPVILTSRVVRSTNWGRELVGRPGVHVIDSLDELAQVVNDIRTAPERLRNALEALVSG